MSNDLFDDICAAMIDATDDYSYLPDEVLAAIAEDEHAADNYKDEE
jgi:hypothetical protein